KATIVDTLTIQWPDGQSTMLENVAADQVLIVTPDMGVDPCPADLDGNGAVGASDLLALLSAWGLNPDHPADLDGDGSVGASDLLILLANWGPCP
ncbi:MAG: ASPIC/UnbV domain-containing protein, partial [Planctomycetota bacterium]|nr:ASPIC/UnbV domain-containing protein [Planctomycetota bacterium]